jgi:hypothetical protein
MSDPTPYNPLDKTNLGASVAEAMLGRKLQPLGNQPVFHGAGIYAIYYSGDLDAYRRVSSPNQEGAPVIPIYVGKAIPAGGRKGLPQTTGTRTKALSNRLREHAESIIAATNLKIEDFSCRYLVVDDIWIPLGESLLIAKFSPIWNTLIDGFGNHDPGKGRYEGMPSKWDVLHPGRTWATKCKGRRPETAAQIAREVKAHLDNLTLPQSPHFLVEQNRAEYRVNR